MRTKLFCGAVFVAGISAWAADKLQPLNVKLGLWEMTATTKTSGEMPIPPEMLSRLSPEQRARMEAKMKAQQGDKEKTRTFKSCLTKEKMEKASLFGDDRKNCKQTILTSTSSKMVLKAECVQEGTKSSGTIEFEAPNPENIKGAGQIGVTNGNQTMNINSTYTGKWLGSACGDVK
jgi:uncharacterized protein DUF3617